MKIVSRLLVVLSFAAVAAAAGYLYYDNKAKLHEIERLKENCPPDPTRPHDDCPNSYTGGMNWVKLEDVVKMVGEYGNNQARNIDSLMSNKLNATRSFADTRFITFPIDTIKKFIAIIEKQTINAGLVNDNGSTIKRCDLGIKFYYGAYTGLKERVDPKKPFQGKHTLVLIPTYLRSKDKIYVEFSPFYVNGNKPMSFPEIRKIDSTPASTDKMVAFSISVTDLDVGKNHGTMCPPPVCDAAILNLSFKNNK